MASKAIEETFAWLRAAGIMVPARTVADEFTFEERDATVSVLSIDAWADGDAGWNWNNWFRVGSAVLADIEGLDDQALRTWFCDNGYTTTADPALVAIDDDQYNIVVCDARDHRPLFAIAYGEAY